ncbi:MAG: ferrous iron transport protein A [Candidatus Njordarchaeum guaymaensis]|nr:MAG: ferrous iron transport protein A [Candidatus Latescibacterota bacterium]
MKVRLSELKPGEVGIIVDIVGGDSITMRRIIEMGMTKGERVKVIRNAPLRDPVEFEVKGYNLSLKRDEAKMIVVEVKR